MKAAVGENQNRQNKGACNIMRQEFQKKEVCPNEDCPLHSADQREEGCASAQFPLIGIASGFNRNDGKEL